jgi:hypothetical protein
VTDEPSVLVPPGVWWHRPLRWWSAWLRLCGYRGRLPAWALGRCQATYPAEACACGMYRVLWRVRDDE